MRLIAALAALTLATQAVAADSARARMEAFSRGLHAVSGRFSQSVTDANGHRGDASRGTLALEAPRQFRWETLAPYQQTIVADGAKVWVYEPDLEQVSVRNQSAAEAHSPLTVLTDLSQLDSQFTASESGEHDGLAWLRLASKAKEPEFEYAELGFDAASLQRMRFKDQLGNVTEIRFSDWKRNPALPADAFRFTPPEGVDVVGDVKPDAEVMPLRD
ncbi:outer membrane lipoprotein chaperone LolA [Dokdonella fugitiva]|jgi:outer membrane lipoprotein carrier protein|uniref:Outer-membrane lipoprotein carrier protein n=1 Tax=Dokdonella fugitiva TaxID=328517 RepID=A0A4R2I889_9GAMM|nr:outer membrane lipoprotein chaperone LolA [Dokdonella fugitiva]MBA8883216.1 outer membrane lipoprotein carrier protein [Dokdonella fugitiva]TCO40327.1 outer membrane lipoprotein carrier protein [Dokdonella fugitiva]